MDGGDDRDGGGNRRNGGIGPKQACRSFVAAAVLAPLRSGPGASSHPPLRGAATISRAEEPREVRGRRDASGSQTRSAHVDRAAGVDAVFDAPGLAARLPLTR
jgi:hypothetical protein